MTDLADIPAPPSDNTLLTASGVVSGPLIEPLTRLLVYNDEQWESFILEWVAECLKGKYLQVQKFGGAGDKGIDIAAFCDDQKLAGVWDLYQCKHYDHPIAPSDIWPEIGKVLWYSFSNTFSAPRAYYFVAPRDVGTKLNLLLNNSTQLRTEILAIWDNKIIGEIGKAPVPLTGKFLAYVEKFDFSIFKSLSPREVVEQHRTTSFFVGRFGGGLPARPKPPRAPAEISVTESIYISKLLDAYGEHKKVPTPTLSELTQWKPLKDHLLRQREAFYHAESLRVFIRDKVEAGTFESLQSEILDAIIDVAESDHADGFECVKQALVAAQNLPLTGHALGSTALTADKRGICHQLANEDRVKWTK
ncbi:ABC-three component system protein [Asticcacaulis tiandongensis]|uniref:ABC-three component system protein n=1 Tax=Asticcacaulis tiandongensis TaxID=2565365 RepID=UPI001C644DF7|nr:ABC-three component system protein [Asticcacaulis tiandongensis]